MAKEPPARFAGVTSPNTTQVPDQYLDELLPVLTGGELKVLLYITRRTFGFKKASDTISLSQMLHGIRTRDGRQLDQGVGLTKKTLLHAIQSLKDQAIIFAERRRSAERGDEPTCYRLNIRGTADADGRPTPVGEKFPQGGGGATTTGAWGRKSPTQQTDLQETGEQQTASSIVKTSKRELHADAPALGVVRAKAAHMTEDVSPTHDPGMEEDGRTQSSGPSLIVEALMTEFSKDFGDPAHARANCTQAVRLLRTSGLSEMAFSRRLYEARSVTRDQINRRRMAGSEVPVQKAMPYFFAVLKDLLSLKGFAKEQKSAAPPADRSATGFDTSTERRNPWVRSKPHPASPASWASSQAFSSRPRRSSHWCAHSVSDRPRSRTRTSCSSSFGTFRTNEGVLRCLSVASGCDSCATKSEVVRDVVWGEGSQLARYYARGARRLLVRSEGSRQAVLLGPTNRPGAGASVMLTSKRVIEDGFLAASEYCEVMVERPTRRLVVTVIFPPGRPPKETRLATMPRGARDQRVAVRYAADGRAYVRWNRLKPSVNCTYSLRWSW